MLALLLLMHIILYIPEITTCSIACSSNCKVSIPTSALSVWSTSNKHCGLSPQISIRVLFPSRLDLISSKNSGTWSGFEKSLAFLPEAYVKILSLGVICPERKFITIITHFR